jgi:putative NADPH-quinone reductase
LSHIVIIQGHPDPAGGHLCHALADAYAQGAEQAGHTVIRIEVANLPFPWLRTAKDFEAGSCQTRSDRRSRRLAQLIICALCIHFGWGRCRRS